MRFAQSNQITDLEGHDFAVFPASLASYGWQRCVYLPAAISERNSSTARRAAMSKSVLDSDA